MADVQLTPAAIIVAGLAKRIGASEIGRKLELSEGAVRSHASGAAIPRPRVQERYRRIYDVPIAQWSHATAATPPTLPPEAPAPASPARESSTTSSAPPRGAQAPETAPDALASVVHLLQVATRQLEAAEADKDAPYQARAQLITSATGLCRLLARLSGQLEVTQAAIVRSAAWRKILAAFEAVAVRHPEAEKAFAELGAALQGLE